MAPDGERTCSMRARWFLEESEFDGEEFFGIFAEVGNQGAHIAAEAGEIVVKLRVVENLAESIVGLIEFGGGLGKIGAGIAQLVVKSIVGGQFAESALAGANVAENGVAIGKSFFGLIVERGVVEQFAEGALLG